MAKKLESLEIRVGEDGSHSAVHSFAREPQKSSGRNSDIYMERPKEEVHNFGPTAAEHSRLKEHIASTLGLAKGKENVAPDEKGTY